MTRILPSSPISASTCSSAPVAASEAISESTTQKEMSMTSIRAYHLRTRYVDLLYHHTAQLPLYIHDDYEL
uniref:Uncharacterized protein n=1 Tax=Oryza sativa subsp. japonica TaxID=39947 RepID=Q9FEA7_ORYSJ|nr:unnamed protein product [Oryza sativa Japonica Group]